MCAARGLNEFLENALPPVTRAFGADRVMLIDYRDNTKRFDLLHFGGYHKQSRFDLQRGLPFMELDKAFSQTTAYFADGNRKPLYVPLYFSTSLEALIVFKPDPAIELTTQRVEIAKVVSKFLGLLMSSSRLGINRNGLVDLNDLQRARQIQLTYLPPENLETDRY